MAVCFLQPSNNYNNNNEEEEEEEDSAIFYSTSDSHEDSTTSSSSLHYNSSSPQQQLSDNIDININHTNTYYYKLSVKNLSYTTNPKTLTFSFLPQFLHKPNKPVRVLNSVSFTARSSEILAIVGPSGTGKSTLLSLISGRAANNYNFATERTVSINDRLVTSGSQLRKLCGFVRQEDSLLPMLTVRETLAFAAKFRLISGEDREERVESVMRDLGLLSSADTLVGDEAGESRRRRGISGGERKRVSIGLEMIGDPRILLLDEPTSGLDSASALRVVELLSAIAREERRTVVVSIHQPSSRILRHVSSLLVLSRGSVAHHGSLHSLEETLSGLGMEIPPQLNPLEFAMETAQTLEEEEERRRRLRHFSNSDDHDHDHGSLYTPTSVSSNNYIKSFCVSNVFEILFLCSRFWKVMYRTRQLFLARTMQALVGGFGLGTVFIKTKRDPEGIAERLGLFAFSLSFLLSSTVEALPIFLQERRVLMKEASRGAYRVSSYMIANTVVFIPFLFVVSILFSAPVYWIVGLNPSFHAFAFFILVVWQIALMASSLALFLGAVSPDLISGNSINSTVLGAFFLFSGYFIPKESIPKYWLFMYYVSLYRYPLDSLLANEYWSLRRECFSWRDGDGGERVCLLTGDDVLKSRGLGEDPRLFNVAVMFGFFVLYRVLCWVVLSRAVRKTTL